MKILPDTLDCFYERALQEIGLEFRSQALVALQLLSHAEHELSLDELAEAMIVDPFREPFIDHKERFMDSRAVLEILPSGLVTHVVTDVSRGGLYHHNDSLCRLQLTNSIGRTCDNIRLTHYSVFEYLSSKRFRSSPAAFFQIEASESQQAIAQVSIAYLQAIGTSNPTISSALYDDYPFLHYAASCLLSHLEILQSNSIQKTLQNLSASFFTKGSHAWDIWVHFGGRNSWTKSFQINNISNDEPLDDAALCRRASNFIGLNPLSVASMLGAVSVMRTLLETVSELDHVADKCELGSPLYAASTFGKIVSLRLLLSKDAAVNARGGPLGKAIHAASGAGHVAIVRTLLAAGSDLDPLSPDHRTTLLMALDCLKENPQSEGHRDVVFVLLEQGADVNCSPNQPEAEPILSQSHSVLITAILSKQEEIISAVLQHGAAVEVKDWLYGTPLQLATQLDCSAIFLRLVECGANIQVRDMRGGLVDIATSHESTSVIQELLRLDSGERDGKSNLGSSLFAKFDDIFRDQVAADAHLGSVQTLLGAGFGHRIDYSNAVLSNFELPSTEVRLRESVMVPNRKRRRSPTLEICEVQDD